MANSLGVPCLYTQLGIHWNKNITTHDSIIFSPFPEEVEPQCEIPQSIWDIS